LPSLLVSCLRIHIGFTISADDESIIPDIVVAENTDDDDVADFNYEDAGSVNLQPDNEVGATNVEVSQETSTEEVQETEFFGAEKNSNNVDGHGALQDYDNNQNNNTSSTMVEFSEDGLLHEDDSLQPLLQQHEPWSNNPGNEMDSMADAANLATMIDDDDLNEATSIDRDGDIYETETTTIVDSFDSSAAANVLATICFGDADDSNETIVLNTAANETIGQRMRKRMAENLADDEPSPHTPEKKIRLQKPKTQQLKKKSKKTK
jgi:hypothetical protein